MVSTHTRSLHRSGSGEYVYAMLPLLLVIIAVVIIAAPGWPSGPTIAAFILALLALIFLLTGWGGHLAFR
jgi:hypothetical protein